MKWLSVVKACVPCAAVVAVVTGLAACASPEVVDALHQLVDVFAAQPPERPSE